MSNKEVRYKDEALNFLGDSPVHPESEPAESPVYEEPPVLQPDSQLQQGQYPPPPPPPMRNMQQPNGNRKKKKKKKKRSRLPGILILTTLIFGVSVILSLVVIGFGKDMFGIGKSDQTHLIVIPENATVEDVAAMLESDGIIRSPKFFTMFSQMREDEPYIPGEHFVRPNMAYETIIEELTNLEEEDIKESVQVTFPEGITIIDAAQILEEEGVCSAKDFIFYFNSGGFGFDFEELLPTDTSIKFMRMEGYLFPDTYYFYVGMDPEQVCQKIYLNFDQHLTQPRLDKIEELGVSLDEVITLASIVQKEAATTGIMKKVASVFWNRLRNSDVFPLLQSDPTSNYANLVVRPNMEVVDNAIVNAYDTYKSAKLPPGAICNPGMDAIDAVLDDYQSNDFYFIANINTKVTYFAETLEEHYANEAEIERQYEEARQNAVEGE